MSKKMHPYDVNQAASLLRRKAAMESIVTNVIGNYPGHEYKVTITSNTNRGETTLTGHRIKATFAAETKAINEKLRKLGVTVDG